MKYIIISAGSHAKVVYDIFRRNGIQNTSIFFIDVFKKRAEQFVGCSIIGGLDDDIKFPKDDFQVILSWVGQPREGIKERKEIIRKINSILKDNPQFKGYCNVIDKSVILSDSVQLGNNISIGVNSFLNIDVRVGDHVIINNFCNIEHDVDIGDHCIISPNVIILGNVKISDSVYIGSGAILRNNIKVGQNSIIGMGSVVTKDVPANSIVTGNPGRIRTLLNV